MSTLGKRTYQEDDSFEPIEFQNKYKKSRKDIIGINSRINLTNGIIFYSLLFICINYNNK